MGQGPMIAPLQELRPWRHWRVVDEAVCLYSANAHPCFAAGLLSARWSSVSRSSWDRGFLFGCWLEVMLRPADHRCRRTATGAGWHAGIGSVHAVRRGHMYLRCDRGPQRCSSGASPLCSPGAQAGWRGLPPCRWQRVLGTQWRACRTPQVFWDGKAAVNAQRGSIGSSRRWACSSLHRSCERIVGADPRVLVPYVAIPAVADRVSPDERAACACMEPSARVRCRPIAAFADARSRDRHDRHRRCPHRAGLQWRSTEICPASRGMFTRARNAAAAALISAGAMPGMSTEPMARACQGDGCPPLYRSPGPLALTLGDRTRIDPLRHLREDASACGAKAHQKFTPKRSDPSGKGDSPTSLVSELSS